MTNYTTAEAAAALGITVGAVRKAIEQGRLAAIRRGGRGQPGQRAAIILIDAAEVERYRAAPRAPGGRPKAGTGGRHVRVGAETDQRGSTRLRVTIGRELWRQLGCPARVIVGDDPPTIRVARPGQGYALAVGSGAPRCLVSGLALPLGIYAAERDGDVLRLIPAREEARHAD